MKYITQAKTLKDLRHYWNITQRNIADMVGVSTSKVHRLESGLIELTLAEAVEYQNRMGLKLTNEFLEKHTEEVKGHNGKM